MENETVQEYNSIVSFGESYGRIHPYIAIPICIFSVITNILNSLVLSSKHLRSATNCLLLSTAVCHLLINIFHLSSLIHDLLPTNGTCESHVYTYEWTVATLVCANISFTLHALATWFTVALAILRCVQLKTKNNRFALPTIALKIINFVTIVVLVICIPNYLAFSVNMIPTDVAHILCENSDLNTVEIWWIGASAISSELDGRPVKIAFELSAALFFLVPCCLLIVAFCYLMSTLSKFGKSHKQLVMHQSCAHVENHTMLLLLILLVFVATQFPQGILTFLCSVLSESYQQNVYQSLGQFMELLSIINGLIGFVVNCAMSSLFRSTFVDFFFLRHTTVLPRKFSYPSVDNVKPTECPQCHQQSNSSTNRLQRCESDSDVELDNNLNSRRVQLYIYFGEGPSEIV